MTRKTHFTRARQDGNWFNSFFQTTLCPSDYTAVATAEHSYENALQAWFTRDYLSYSLTLLIAY
jgi:hypothetical protein